MDFSNDSFLQHASYSNLMDQGKQLSFYQDSLPKVDQCGTSDSYLWSKIIWNKHRTQKDILHLWEVLNNTLLARDKLFSTGFL